MQHNAMNIQIRSTLTKTRNPKEHGFKIEGHRGELIQSLDDGYHLIKFDQFSIKKQVKIDSKTTWKFEALEWYVHEADFHLQIIGKQQ